MASFSSRIKFASRNNFRTIPLVYEWFNVASDAKSRRYDTGAELEIQLRQDNQYEGVFNNQETFLGRSR